LHDPKMNRNTTIKHQYVFMLSSFYYMTIKQVKKLPESSNFADIFNR
jgi:hypothetical protein